MGNPMPISRRPYVMLCWKENGLRDCQLPAWVDRKGEADSLASHMMVQPLMQRAEATAWRL